LQLTRLTVAAAPPRARDPLSFRFYDPTVDVAAGTYFPPLLGKSSGSRRGEMQ
jgi:hypothetical protein